MEIIKTPKVSQNNVINCFLSSTKKFTMLVTYVKFSKAKKSIGTLFYISHLEENYRALKKISRKGKYRAVKNFSLPDPQNNYGLCVIIIYALEACNSD